MYTTYKTVAVVILMLVFVYASPLHAQITLSGRVQDDSGSPVSFVNVQLLVAADSSFYKGGIADEEGNYLFDAVRPGNYLLYVSLIGYHHHISELLDIAGVGSQQLESVTLVQDAVEMDEIRVEARRELYELKGDRMVIHVGTSVTLSGGTALDVLERSPGVLVNEQAGTISMLGKDGVNIMINGKLSYIPTDGLLAFLSGISAENVEQIELITSPSAEFDAEGNAGFINIVLKRSGNAGLNGSLSVSGGYGGGEVGRGSFAINYRKNRLVISGNYSLSWTGQSQYFDIQRSLQFTNLVEIPVQSRRDPVDYKHDLRLGLDYELSEKTTMGAVVAGFFNKFKMTAVTEASVSTGGTLEFVSRSDIDMFNRWQHLMGNVNLQHKLTDASSFDVDVDYLYYHNKMPTDNFTVITDVISGDVSENEIGSRKLTPLSIIAAKADYHVQPSEQLGFDAGVKGAFSRFTNETTFASPFESDLSGVSFGTESRLQEDVLAAYATSKVQFSAATALDVGLRYELTDSNLGVDEEKNVVDRKFGAFFPSASIQQQLSELARVNVSFSRRITRPKFNDLASFTRFDDPYSLYTGNVALQPAITNAVKLDFTYRSMLTSLQYAWEDSSIVRFQTRRLPGQNVYLLLPLNMNGTRTATALFAVPVEVAGWWNTQNNIMTMWQEVEWLRNESSVTERLTSVRINTTQNFSLPGDFDFEATCFYQSATLMGATHFESMWGVNLGLQKTLHGGKGQLIFAVDDLFDSVESLWVTGAPGDPFYNKWAIDLGHRTFRVTYSRRFGENSGARKRATASESERGRVQ